jgi:tricorn protease
MEKVPGHNIAKTSEVNMRNVLIAVLIALMMTGYGLAMDDARLLRFPDINKDIIAFVYAGDLWTVPAEGGNATRMTSHEGLELFPKISPDGRWIAFSGEYSGSRQVFIIPAEGGPPKQLTYYNDVGELPPRGGFDHIPLDWTPDSQQVLIRANRTPYGKRQGKFFLVPVAGGLETPLQIPEGGFGTFSPDAKSIVYTPISRAFRTWKRYKGGRAQDVWIYDLVNNTSERLTTFPGTDQHPTWYKDKIFFVSDRDLHLNFWSYDLKTKEVKQITNHQEFDVLWPSGQDGQLAYENGGYIYILDLDTGKSRKVTINIRFDNPNRLPYFKKVSEFISEVGAGISPEGKEAVFDARGDIFTVPAEKGITANLTRTQGVREMYPVWSPDGQWIAYISDQTGDYELYLLAPGKSKTTVQVTNHHKVWKFPPVWSPDSKMLVFSDMNRQLQVLDLQTKAITVVDEGYLDDITDYQWSGDSQWIVYTKAGKNSLSAIRVYSLERKKSYLLSSGKYNDSNPVFSQCGRYIFFISDRDFNINGREGFSTMEFDYIYNKTARLYAMALTTDAPNLFMDKEAEAGPAKGPGADKSKKNQENRKEKEMAAVRIDLAGIQERVAAFPLETANYNFLADLGGRIFYGKGRGNDRELRIYNLDSRKDDLVIKGVRAVSLATAGQRLLYSKGPLWGIIDIKPGQKAGDGELSLDNLVMKIDPEKEWRQIYNEGWRLFRDWFYVKNMHGLDWKKIRAKYEPLLPYVSHRVDLDYIFGELVGELNVGHTYVNYGDFKRVERLDNGLLGAELQADQASGRYRFTKIYPGENWNEDTCSPLTEQGIDVKENDYLISLNGYDVTTRDNPYRFLENTAGKKIPITVNAKPTAAGARTYWIKPIKSEQGLFYLDWVTTRREMVERLSNGRIGYIHVPDTAVEGNRELFKGLYAYSNKEALIIDERYNRGGWTPEKMIGKLAERTVNYWYSHGLALTKSPRFALEAPMAMLINHYSASGGDDLPYWFRLKNLGKLIGTRTWGGLVGIGGSPQLVDGPTIDVPVSGIVSTGGEFVVEGIGVYPDEGFEVYDRPEEVAKGNDPSIQAAVKYLLEELEKHPVQEVQKPAEPNRSAWHEKMKEE